VKLDELMKYLFDYEDLADAGAGQRKKYVLRPLASNKSGMAIKYDTLMTGRKQDKKLDEFITGYNYKAVLAKSIFQNFIAGARISVQEVNADFNQVLDSGREYGSLKRKKFSLDMLMDPIYAAQGNNVILLNVRGIDFSKTNSPFSNETHYTPYGAIWRIRPIESEGYRSVATLDISFPTHKYEEFVFPDNILNLLIPDLPMIVGYVKKTDLNDGYGEIGEREFSPAILMDIIFNNYITS
jgi:hypothetical protein